MNNDKYDILLILFNTSAQNIKTILYLRMIMKSYKSKLVGLANSS